MSRPSLDERDDLTAMPPQVPRLEGNVPKPPLLAGSSTTSVEHLPSHKPIPKEFDLRPGDSGEDRPFQIPQSLAPLSDADQIALKAAEEHLLMRELREAEELVASEPSVLRLPAYLSHPLMGAVFIGSAALIGLFVFNQIMTALTTIGTLQGVLMYACYAGLGLLASCALYALLRLFWMYVKLRRNKQLRLKGLEELEKRTKLRWLVNAKVKEAKAQLENYLREFPLAAGREQKRLVALGMNESLARELSQIRDKLLDPNSWPSDDVWFDAFRETFQARLDEIASARVNYWARRTALGTAVSPNTLSDTLMTLYFSFTLLADLCAIYNLRAGKLGTAVLLARVFFNAYLAGQMNEMENMTAEQIQNLVAPHIPASELLLAKVLGKMGAKASAGVINFFLLNRLGKYASRMLRPVTRD